MLLAVDVGNTQTVIGMFERTELLQHWRLATRGDQTADEMALVFQGLLNQVGLSFDRNVSGVVISSVVPRVTQAMREMTERYFHFAPIIVGPGVQTGLAITTDNPKEVGDDRVVDSITAYSRYGGQDLVINFRDTSTSQSVGAKSSE